MEPWGSIQRDHYPSIVKSACHMCMITCNNASTLFTRVAQSSFVQILTTYKWVHLNKSDFSVQYSYLNRREFSLTWVIRLLSMLPVIHHHCRVTDLTNQAVMRFWQQFVGLPDITSTPWVSDAFGLSCFLLLYLLFRSLRHLRSSVLLFALAFVYCSQWICNVARHPHLIIWIPEVILFRECLRPFMPPHPCRKSLSLFPLKTWNLNSGLVSLSLLLPHLIGSISILNLFTVKAYRS